MTATDTSPATSPNRSKTANRLRTPALVIGSAGALYLAQPGAQGAGGLAWIALVPLFIALGEQNRRGAFGVGFAWGVVYNLLLLTWLLPFGMTPWLGMTLVQSLILALFAALAAPSLRKGGGRAVWGVAALWVMAEQLRTWATFGLSWGDLSLTQASFPSALQMAGWWGALGLSFIVALANTALSALLLSQREASRASERSRWAAYTALAVILLSLLGGGISLWRKRALLGAQGVLAPVGVVQANVARTPGAWAYADPEATFRAHARATEALARHGCRRVFWPETALPETLFNARDRAAALARRLGIWLFTGAGDSEGPDREYNAILVFSPEGRLLHAYHKRRIVPFGEFVPWRAFLPSLEAFGVPATDLTPGEGSGLVDAGGLKPGLGVCFESLFPDLALQARHEGADLLAVATNDSYYGRTPAAAMHAASLQLRAVETGLPAVQAAITGYSLAISPDGSVLRRSGLYTADAFAVALPRPLPPTLWTRAPWLAWLIVTALAGYGAGIGLEGRRSPRRRVTPADPHGAKT